MSVPSCTCGDPGAYSLTPGEWIDHRTEEPCVIVRSRLAACDCETCAAGDDQWCCRTCHDLARKVGTR